MTMHDEQSSPFIFWPTLLLQQLLWQKREKDLCQKDNEVQQLSKGGNTGEQTRSYLCPKFCSLFSPFHFFKLIIMINIMATPCIEGKETPHNPFPKTWLSLFTPNYLWDSLERILGPLCTVTHLSKKLSNLSVLDGWKRSNTIPHLSLCVIRVTCHSFVPCSFQRGFQYSQSSLPRMW